MPTYDYECDACGHRFELFQSIRDPLETDCPECHQPRLRRLIGAGAAIVFKGSGFYQTDYRSDSYKNRAKADSEGGSGSKESKDKSASSGSEKSGTTSSEPKTPSTGSDVPKKKGGNEN